jgi:uncharacterized protein (TIRG00374 family)
MSRGMPKLKKPGAILLGVLASIFFLWVAFRGISPGMVWEHIRAADPVLLTLAILNHTAGIHIRAARWRFLLEPVTSQPTPYRARLSATSIGLAANNLIPLRVGEFARVVSLARQTFLPIPVVMGTLVMERVLDGLVQVAVIFIVMSLPTFPETTVFEGLDPRDAARTVLAVAGAIGVFLALLTLFPTRCVRLARSLLTVLPAGWRRPLADSLRAFLRGLGVLRSVRHLVISVAYAVGQWSFLGLGFYLGFLAFGIEGVGFGGAMFFQALIGFAVAVPSTPGFFGPWEAASRYTLAFWGIPEAEAVSFAIAFHDGTYVLMTGLGVYYLWKLGFRWRDLRSSASTVEAAVERRPHQTG